MLANHIEDKIKRKKLTWQYPKINILSLYWNDVTEVYMQWRVILHVDFQYHWSSCQATYQNAGFMVKDAKISTSYTKQDNKILFSSKNS